MKAVEKMSVMKGHRQPKMHFQSKVILLLVIAVELMCACV
jgi:hypothetical protein